MDRIFDAFSKRKGVAKAALKFLIEGQRIKGDETPESLDLEDQDQIDCLLEQTGGC